MKKKNYLITALCLIVTFIVWTIAISLIDVQAVGPQGTVVGFATINKAFHALTGTNMDLYVITDWLGLIPLSIIVIFAIWGLIQWIKRKRIMKVDRDILVLGCFYIVVMATYVLFETFTINYRPILIDGFLEGSYPSSTTMLVLCVIPTTIIQINQRMSMKVYKTIITLLLSIFIAYMIIGRLFSGVHWLTDIIGGALISSGLVLLYYSVI